MTSVRLLADDLTGALDTAAEFVGMTGPMPVFWAGAMPLALPPSIAIDSGTREQAPAEAIPTIGRLAPLIGSATIAFKKIDSLLRGPTIAELAACMRLGLWKYCVLCPAFPYQGRVTRDGRQFVRGKDGGWSAVTDDLATALRAEGAIAYRSEPGAPLRPGIAVFDAETDDDLRHVVATSRTAGRILWSGSGGLAQALNDEPSAEATEPQIRPIIARPILGLFGSDHAVTAAQLDACDPHWIKLSTPDVAGVSQRLRDEGLVFASFEFPSQLDRGEAAQRIRSGFTTLLRDLPPPETLLVAGGETLAGVCAALGGSHLEVQGRIVPGVPRSIMRGGRWDGVTVISKSGAFGTPALLRDLVVRRA